MSAFEKIGTDRQLQDHWIRRLIAIIIDGIIVFIIGSIVSAVLFSPWLFHWLVFPFIGGIISIFYFAVLELFYEATIGKRVMNLKVTTQDGGRPTFDLLIIRNISKIHGLLLLLDTLLGFFTVGDPHQKFSDRFARTTVVSAISGGLILPSPPSPLAPPTPPSSG